MTALSASSAGTWTQICEQSDHAPATTNSISEPHLRHLPCPGARVRICRPIAFSGKFFTEAIWPEGAIYLVGTPYSPVIPPRNNRVTRSCWTASLSPVKFAPHAADLRCCGRCKCHVGSNSRPLVRSSAFFSRSVRVQLRLLLPCFS